LDFRLEHNSFENVTTGMYIKGSNEGVGNAGTIRYNSYRGFRHGIELTESQPGLHVDVSQNLFYDWNQAGAGHAIAFENSVAALHRNFRVFSNTIISAPMAGTGGVALEATINMSGDVFRDNIVAALESNSQVLVNGWEIGSLGPFAAWDHNWYFNAGAAPTAALNGAIHSGLAAWRTASGRDASSVASDPQFVNAAAKDYRLKPTSPARTASSTAGPVGAYLTGDEVIGVRLQPPY
jgi:hypothetical protein